LVEFRDKLRARIGNGTNVEAFAQAVDATYAVAHELASFVATLVDVAEGAAPTIADMLALPDAIGAQGHSHSALNAGGVTSGSMSPLPVIDSNMDVTVNTLRFGGGGAQGHNHHHGVWADEVTGFESLTPARRRDGDDDDDADEVMGATQHQHQLLPHQQQQQGHHPQSKAGGREVRVASPQLVVEHVAHGPLRVCAHLDLAPRNVLLLPQSVDERGQAVGGGGGPTGTRGCLAAPLPPLIRVVDWADAAVCHAPPPRADAARGRRESILGGTISLDATPPPGPRSAAAAGDVAALCHPLVSFGTSGFRDPGLQEHALREADAEDDGVVAPARMSLVRAAAADWFAVGRLIEWLLEPARAALDRLTSQQQLAATARRRVAALRRCARQLQHPSIVYSTAARRGGNAARFAFRAGDDDTNDADDDVERRSAARAAAFLEFRLAGPVGEAAALLSDMTMTAHAFVAAGTTGPMTGAISGSGGVGGQAPSYGSQAPLPPPAQQSVSLTGSHQAKPDESDMVLITEIEDM
jgi:hypothetical protein